MQPSNKKSNKPIRSPEYQKFVDQLNEKLNITPWQDWRSNSEKDRLGVSWSMGGTSGNCWDDHISKVSGDVEPDFKEIDIILNYYCPHISYMQYKMMHNKLLHKDQGGEGDYYGGHITYGYKYVYLEELFDWLKEKGYITETTLNTEV